jgi:ligand-binding sensor domain-containing protein
MKGSRILAATDHEIWAGTLGGEWQTLEGTLPEGTRILSLAVSPRNRNLLYAASDRGLFWSPDNGRTWHLARLFQGEPFEKQVNAVLPTKTSALWLATEEDGVVIGIDRVKKDGWFRGLLSLLQ